MRRGGGRERGSERKRKGRRVEMMSKESENRILLQVEELMDTVEAEKPPLANICV